MLANQIWYQQGLFELSINDLQIYTHEYNRDYNNSLDGRNQLTYYLTSSIQSYVGQQRACSELMMSFGIALVLTCCAVSIYAEQLNDGDPTGQPLYLTPLIKAGKIAKAREAAKVPLTVEGKQVESYAGFLTVNSTYNSNLYFWFFPAEQNANTAPVIVWLQGGPGGSSLFGLFAENGALVINRSLSLKLRQYYWSQKLNVIYIDNPVGTGFSFTDNDAGYSTNEVEVGANLYTSLIQFFTLFPHLKKNDFFISGESYAGKYVPALGYAIHQNNPTARQKINLVGVAIGDGWIDPVHMMVYSSYLYQHGFIDGKTQRKMKKMENQVVKLIQQGNYHRANNVWNSILGLFGQEAGNIDEYQYLVADDADWADKGMALLFEKDDTRKLMHVGNLTYHGGSKVYNKLFDDMPKSVAPWLEVLLDNYRVLLYSGQLDIIVAYPLTVNFVKQLHWSGASQYLNSPRKQWYVGKRLAGYTINVGNLTQVLVRDAGHMVPQQQPQWALDMIERFTQGVPFQSKPSQNNLKELRKIKLL